MKLDIKWKIVFCVNINSSFVVACLYIYVALVCPSALFTVATSSSGEACVMLLRLFAPCQRPSSLPYCTWRSDIVQMVTNAAQCPLRHNVGNTNGVARKLFRTGFSNACVLFELTKSPHKKMNAI